MVKETRIIFEIQDVQGVRVRCSHCKAAIVLHLADSHAIPDACPSCLKDWRQTRDNRYAASRLLSAMRDVLREQDAPMKVLLELDGEQEGQPGK